MTPAARRRLLQHAVVALAGFALAWAVVAWAVFPGGGTSDAITVPPVVGLAYDAAAGKLRSLGLKATAGESRLSGSAPQGTVIAQTPPAGARTATGTTIVLDVSAGQQRTTVPPIVGLDRDAAAAALRSSGLSVGEVSEQPATEPRGAVIATRPEAGQTVPQGTAVQLTLSSGPAELTMPDVAGRNVDEARALLEQLGLVVTIEYDSTASGVAGAVRSHTPEAGSPLATGSTVTLRVAGRR